MPLPPSYTDERLNWRQIIHGLAAWIVGVLTAAFFSSLGHIPLNVLLALAVLGLPAWIAGTMAGAWFYEASERRPAPALTAA